jgi:hypothetical protein
MTIRKAVRKTESDVSPVDIDRVINAGSPPAPLDNEKTLQMEIKFQMVISAELCRLIDGDRKLSKTSRRAWLLQAAQEKLERSGKL